VCAKIVSGNARNWLFGGCVIKIAVSGNAVFQDLGNHIGGVSTFFEVLSRDLDIES
jgi:hypothetical protein